MNFLRQFGGAVGVNGRGVLLAWRQQAPAALGQPGTLRASHEVFVLMALLMGAAALAAWGMRPGRPGPPGPPKQSKQPKQPTAAAPSSPA